MKLIYRIIFFVGLLLLFCIACSTEDTPPILTTISTQENSLIDRYTHAIQQWQARQIDDYEITVNMYSSLLTPPCHMRVTLVVEDNVIKNVTVISTPEAVKLSDGQLLTNPICVDYDKYRITSTFELLDLLLHSNQDRVDEVRFDPEYGYITYLRTSIGETMQEIKISDFKPK